MHWAHGTLVYGRSWEASKHPLPLERHLLWVAVQQTIAVPTTQVPAHMSQGLFIVGTMVSGWARQHVDMEMPSTLLALCEGKPPATGRFPSQSTSNAELWCFLCCQPKQTLEPTIQLPVIWDTMMLMWWQGCWWPGNGMSQGISNHGIDLVFSEYSSFSTRRVKKQMWWFHIVGPLFARRREMHPALP